MRNLTLAILALLCLSACAPQLQRISSTATSTEKPVWAFETSDVPVDPAYRFGRLNNGMRYIIRHNETPKGTVAIRMEVGAGSLDESDSERGFAHFVEHMAFNGSTHVPEGEMIKLLERKGLSFGADTNAFTSFEQTQYVLDLPRNDPELISTALMLMRETAGELTFDPGAISRERGVVLAEKRDRSGWQMRNLEDQLAFFAPSALYPKRMPIGTTEALNGATASSLKSFWQRHYVPAKTTLIIVGDIVPDDVEAAIKARFADWQPAVSPGQPPAGPIHSNLQGETDIYIDPALSEQITAARTGPWMDEPDSIAWRRTSFLRRIGYAIINRRLQRISRQGDPPFRGAGYGTGDIFKSGRSTNLLIDTVDGKWQRGLAAATLEFRRAMRLGFTQAEVDEQLANLRTSLQNESKSESTRRHASLVFAAINLIRNDRVPTTPTSELERFDAFASQITAKRVLSAIRKEALPLNNPMLRFQGRRQPVGGEEAIRAAWNVAQQQTVSREGVTTSAVFAYTDFGQEGQVASNTMLPDMGIRTLRFSNGLRLNLKRTEIERDRVNLQLNIDGGDMLATKTNPLATAMVGAMASGGLGKHSQDDLQTILAGHSVSMGISSAPLTFIESAQTTPRDLELQLQLMAAQIADPGYRVEGQTLYLNTINTFFAQKNTSPNSALNNAIGGILSDNDPRFTLQSVDDYRKLNFAKLKADIGERLAHGAIELAIVGDFDEEKTIALVGKTLGAMPARELEFQSYTDKRNRAFTADKTPRIVRHTGQPDQALLRITWPTQDDSDQKAAITLALMDRILQNELSEVLREKLGKSYSPSAASSPSHYWLGYGTFAIAASVDVKEVSATRSAMLEAVARLRNTPITSDQVLRARQPLIEARQNALKSNGGWMNLADRAQSEPQQIERFQKSEAILQSLTAADIQAMAQRYLKPETSVEVLVLPEKVEMPKP